MKNKNFLEGITEEYIWDETRGLFISKSMKLISNSVPIVQDRKLIKNAKTGEETKLIEVCFLLTSEKEEDYIVKTFSEDEITSGKFRKKIPFDVCFQNVSERKVHEVFKGLIKLQACLFDYHESFEYEYGWNDDCFYWGSRVNFPEKYTEYSIALEFAEIIKYPNKAISGVFLGALHGVLKRLFQKSGIYHDFTTYVVGDSGIGKTELCRMFCDYVPNKNVIFSLASNRKELLMKFQKENDSTIVIDDFNKTESKRTYERQLQILGECISLSSGSGKPLLDDSINRDAQNTIHIIVTAEEIINNISTLNRCFLIQMDEKIPDEIWSKICKFVADNKMWYLIKSFISYVEREQENSINIRTTYEFYQNEYSQNNILKKYGNSPRINNTLAVQTTLKHIFITYLKTLEIDNDIKNEIDENIGCSIMNCGEELYSYINVLRTDGKHLLYLRELADIILGVSFGRFLTVETVNEYINWTKNPGCQQACIGVYEAGGYLAFSGKDMCAKISNRLPGNKATKKNISSKTLSNNLHHYGLLKINSEGRLSWGDEGKRLYHVNILNLLELIYPEKQCDIEDFMPYCKEDYEENEEECAEEDDEEDDYYYDDDDDDSCDIFFPLKNFEKRKRK